MKILIDIGHPAHVHYFKNFIKIMEGKGHIFFISARDKEVTFELLKNYYIAFHSRGRGGKGTMGKLLYLLKGDAKLFRFAKMFKPDLLLSFGSSYAAHVSKLLGKPHIAFDDTEHAKLEHALYVPFTNAILTPDCFEKNFGEKHIRFSGFIELCSLHPNYFQKNANFLKEYNLTENKYVIVRFISWEASHDIGHFGLSLEIKYKVIDMLKSDYELIISSEGKLPSDLEKYRMRINPSQLHDLISFAKLYIGEGATTAAECAMLGTPAIYINSLDAGTLKEHHRRGLIYSYRNSDGVLEKIKELISSGNLKEEFQHRSQKMLSEKIDVTAFMVWFVENYPESIEIMKANPDYQYNFR